MRNLMCGKPVFELVMAILSAVIIACCANSFFLIADQLMLFPVVIAAFIISLGLPYFSNRTFPNRAIALCNFGSTILAIFAVTLVVSIVWQITLIVDRAPVVFDYSVSLCIIAETIVFWLGIILVYCSSVQLGIRLRTLGLLLGLIPILNLVMLFTIISVTAREVQVETEKFTLNQQRNSEQICRTKYPILLVHGVFFRDFRYLNYWGRIPQELIDNGATLFYGNHESATPVAKSGRELAQRIRDIVERTGCEKVNIIAHSKGGLDCRYAIAHENIAQYVASLTTINTPHRGCKFAEVLLQHTSFAMQRRLANSYNKTLRRLGDKQPDFIGAVQDLTSERAQELDLAMPTPEGVLCQSVGSRLNRATSGKFPLNVSYHLVKYFDGPNDGLVGQDSVAWGSRLTFVTVTGNRGVSHGDMIDLNRENIPGFDVREFYVGILHDLQQQGL